MTSPTSSRFAIHIAIVFLLLGLVQLAGSLVFYQLIDRQTLRDDHARRVAELLVVAQRMYMIAPETTAERMTTRHLEVEIGDRPLVTRTSEREMLADINERTVAWEPSLQRRPLYLATTAARTGRSDLIGSMQLADGAWLNFRSRDISTMWPIALRATVLTLVLTAAFLLFGLFAIHVIGSPLRRLTDAAEAIGTGRFVTIEERGPKDLVDLAHAMNVMQERIDRLLRDQALAFDAIGHDLRTPLARQKMAAHMVADEELREMLNESVEEMSELLTSLQNYLRAQHLTAIPEPIDVTPFLTSVLEGFGDSVTIRADDVRVTSFREPLALAVQALVENAVQYSGSAEVALEREGDRLFILVSDHGPGIPEEYHQRILEPFFRLDEARQRNTKGFGLGIPTTHRLMMRFNGGVSFSTPENGGLIARLQVPQV